MTVQQRRIHWLAPCLMIGSLTLALLFCVGHHLFYRSLAGSKTDGVDYQIAGTDFTGQQVNIAAGTAFAFLAKAAFLLSVSTAYYQAFWRMVKHSSDTRKLSTLGRLDDAYSALGNIFALGNVPLWFRSPLMFLVVLIAWLLPIASIITPATLSVALAKSPLKITLQNVPSLDFSSLGLVGSMPSYASSNTVSLFYTYNGPSQPAKKIAVAVAAGGFILPINAPFLEHAPNSSWSLDFFAPSLQCDDVSEGQRLAFERNIASYIGTAGCHTAAPYLAWFPHPTGTNSSTAEPYQNRSDGNRTTWTFDTANAIFNTGLNDYILSSQQAIMYVAILPNMIKARTMTLSAEPLACSSKSFPNLGITPTNPLGYVGGNVTMLQCQFYNSSYHTEFEYVNGVQSVATSTEVANTVPIINVVRGPGRGGPSNSSDYCATLNEVGAYRVNDTGIGIYGETCEYDPDLLPQLSYQATLQAFTDLITGSITRGSTAISNSSAGIVSSGSVTLVDNSLVRSTELLRTRELNFLSDISLHKQTDLDTGPDLQHSLFVSNESQASGMTLNEQDAPTKSLKDALETMFQNFTVSLMSSESLRANRSSPSGPPKTKVTSSTVENVYVYAEKTLWIAYGLAALSTFGAVVVGCLAIISTGAAYDNNFSTILRATRKAELGIDVPDQDLHGTAPLPKYLTKATVTFPRVFKLSPSPKEDVVDNTKDATSTATTLLKDEAR